MNIHVYVYIYRQYVSMFIGWLSRQPKKNGRRASPFTHGRIEKYGEYVKYMRSIKNDVHVILDACISQQNHSWFYHVLSCSIMFYPQLARSILTCPVLPSCRAASSGQDQLVVPGRGFLRLESQRPTFELMENHLDTWFQYIPMMILDTFWIFIFGRTFWGGLRWWFWSGPWISDPLKAPLGKTSRFRASLGGDHRCPLRFPCEVLVQRNP